MNDREIAINILVDIFKQNSYNNLSLQKAFSKNKSLSSEEKAFITELVNGTMRNVIFIDYIINQFSSTKTNKMKFFVLNILRISVYQIMFMPKIPPFAICNEAVNIAKRRGFTFFKGFINAVTKNICKNKDNIKLPDKKDKLEYLSIKYSYPKWILKYWLLELDINTISQICKSTSLPPKICICINTNKTNKDNLKKMLEKDNIFFEEGLISKNSLYIKKTKDITKNDAFKKGYFHIMDESSMLLVEALAPKEGQTIIDVCAAPGGKSFYCSYFIKDNGKIFARDIFEHKINILNEGKKRLDLNSIIPQLKDATVFFKEDALKADCVIVDAPCSGLGILGKKPDIKYTKTIEDIQKLAMLQKQILKASAGYVKKGGVLVYSTCTISKKENIDNVNWFLQNFDFKLKPFKLNKAFKTEDKGYVQILQSMFNTDGFFIAKFERL